MKDSYTTKIEVTTGQTFVMNNTIAPFDDVRVRRAIIMAIPRDILAKEIFTSIVPFPEGRSQAGVVEELEQIIPLPDRKAGPNYEIIVGFQLTEEQLQQNRKRRRFP